MTCIVGLIENDVVYIGGDSAGVSGLDVRIRKDPKVFNVGEFIFGCTSSYRMIQLIRYSFVPSKVPEKDSELFKYLCTIFVNRLRMAFAEGGFKETDKGVETGGVFLVGYKNRLFKIHSDFQVSELFDSYEACGCGEDYAKGALYNIDSSLKPEEKIIKALETATYFSGGVRPPFIIKNTKNIDL